MKRFLIYVFLFYSLMLSGQTPPFSIQYGHNNIIHDAQFKSDGNTLFSAGKDGLVNVWDIKSGYNIHTYKGFSGPVNNISLSLGDSLLVVGLDLGRNVELGGEFSDKLALLNLKNEEITYPFEIPEKYHSLPFLNFSFFENDEYLIAWTFKDIIVWSLEDGAIQTFIKIENGEQPIGLIGESKEFLIRNIEEGFFSTYTLLKNKSITKRLSLKPSTRNCYPLIHPNGKWIMYKDINDRTILSVINTGEEIREFSLFSEESSNATLIHSFSPKGDFVATLSYTKPPFKFGFNSNIFTFFVDIIISETSTGKIVHKFEQVKNTNLGVKFSPLTNSIILYGGSDFLPMLHYWDWKNNRLIKELAGKVGKVDVIQKNNSESLIAFADIDYRTLRVLDMNTLTITPLQDNRLFGQNIYEKNVKNVGATSLAFDTSGKKLISSNWSNKVYVWDLENYNIDNILVSPDSNEIINNICFGHDNNHIITGSEFVPTYLKPAGDFSDIIKSFDTINFFKQWSLKNNVNTYDDHISIDDKLNKLKYWNLEEENFVGFQDLHKAIYSIKYLPLKKHFATVEYAKGIATFGRWEINTGKQTDFLPMDYLDSNLRNFAISEQGTLFARGSENGKLEIYEESGYKFELPEHDHISTLDFSASKKYLAVGLQDSDLINIWDLESRKKIKTLKGHWNTIQHLTFLKDDNYLVSCSIDGNMIFWDWKKEQLLFYCVSLKDNDESVIISKDNYYKSTKNGIQALVVNDGQRTFSFEQFDLKLNRPDKVLSLLPDASPIVVEAYRKAYLRRLVQLGFTEEMLSDDFHTPEIVVNNENIPNRTKNMELRFNVKAYDTKVNLDRINVWVNDVPIYGRNGINLRNQNTQNWEGEIILQLSKGENKIQVSTFNQGAAESLKETFYITYEAPSEKPNLYLVSIGVTQYKDTIRNLGYPAKDALDLSTLFSEENEFYKNIYFETLTDESVVLDSLSLIKRLLNQSTVDDVVIIFYAGHGLIDTDSNLFLSTFNVNFNNPKEGGLPYERLESLLDGIPARQKMLLMDACHSGEIDTGNLKKEAQDDLKKEPQYEEHKEEVRFRTSNTDSTFTFSQKDLNKSFNLMKELFVDLRRSTGATVIASADGLEEARESTELQNGVFTYALMKGLSEKLADKNRDGKILVSELHEYLRQRVPEMTNGLQQPTSRVFNITNDFRIW